MAVFQKMIRSRRSSGFLICAGLLAIAVSGCDRGPAASGRDPVATELGDLAESIRTLGLRSEGAYGLLERLCAIGPRLTGSEGAAKAVAWAQATLESAGFEAWLEPVAVERWIRGKEEASMFPGGSVSGVPLAITALGGSVSTPVDGLSAGVVEVRSFEDLDNPDLPVKGRIVFFNRAFDRTLMDTFRAYGEAAQYRVRGASEAARRGAAAVLVRSATGRIDDHPHTGIVTYDPAAPKVPAAALSTRDADRLSASLAGDPALRVRLVLGCRTVGEVPSANVIGQIRGSERPEEIVLLGAHIDSWDLAEGAHDDGAGCAQCLEALRLIRAALTKPKRTIRAVLFMNEEFGATGGRDYAAAARRRGERHIAAIESDRGAAVPIGFHIGGSAEVFDQLKALAEPLLRPSGITWVRPGGGGADIGPLAAGGTVLMSFMPDVQRYFDFHHSALDRITNVHPRELELGAVVMAVMAAALAQKGI